MGHKEFDLARENPANQDPLRQAAIDDAEHILLAADVAWPIKFSDFSAATEKTPRIEIKDSLVQIREDWGKEPHTPEFVTGINRRIFELAKPHIEIPFMEPYPIPASEIDISEHESKGEIAIFQPRELAISEKRHHLAQGFKLVGNMDIPESNMGEDIIRNVNLQWGWRWVSAEADSPHLDFSPNMASEQLFGSGSLGLDFNSYLTLALQMKILKDIYPDERTSTILASSRWSMRFVGADFNRGKLGVHRLMSYDRHSTRGVRVSSEIK